MRWGSLVWLGLIGSALLVATSGKPVLAPAEKRVAEQYVDSLEAAALVKAAMPPEIEKLPNLMILPSIADFSILSFEACTFRDSHDGQSSCDPVASFVIRADTGQVCMRVPARDFLWRDVRNPNVAALQDEIRKRLGLTVVEYEKRKIECN